MARHDGAVILIPNGSWDYPVLSSNHRMRIWRGDLNRNDRLHIYGWGASSRDGSGVGKLREGDGGVRISVTYVGERHFNALGYTARTCRADSGGPATKEVDRDLPSRQWIVGTATSANLAGACTEDEGRMRWHRVRSSFDEWIREVIEGDFMPYSSTERIECNDFDFEGQPYARCW